MRTLIFLLLPLIIFLGACSSFDAPSSVPAVTIVIEEPARLRFHGKGAGAGMMLMSSMGPMGIAVGVAIDEGIGKDIEKAAQAEGLDIESIVRAAFINIANDNPAFTKITTIKVQRYGFVTRSGEGDPVAAQLHLMAVLADGKEVTVKYPEDFTDAEVKSEPLDQVKIDGALGVNMYRNIAPLGVLRLLVNKE